MPTPPQHHTKASRRACRKQHTPLSRSFARQDHHPIDGRNKAQQRIVRATLRCHHHWLDQLPPEHTQELAQQIQPILPLQLPKIDIEIDLLDLVHPEDCQHPLGRPHTQLHRLVARAAQHVGSTGRQQPSPPARPPTAYPNGHPADRTRSSTACQSAIDVSSTRTSGKTPLISGSNQPLTSSHSKSGTTSCCPASTTTALTFRSPPRISTQPALVPSALQRPSTPAPETCLHHKPTAHGPSAARRRGEPPNTDPGIEHHHNCAPNYPVGGQDMVTQEHGQDGTSPPSRPGRGRRRSSRPRWRHRPRPRGSFPAWPRRPGRRRWW